MYFKIVVFSSFQEEEEKRRLEALKRERQKRIASKNGSKAVQSPLNSNQSNHEKNSKFKASEIGSNLPIQKLPILNVSTKGIKATTSNKSSYVALSLSDLKESEKQEGNSVSARIRRLSEPKYSRVSSVQAKSTSTNKMMKKPLAKESRSKKMPAIKQLDITNLEVRPELKITAEGNLPEILQNKPATKQQKMAVGKISLISESSCAEMNPEKNPKLSQIDDYYPLIEKTVMIVENKVAPAHDAQTFEGRIDALIKSPQDTKIESATRDVGYAAIYASSSSIGRGHSGNQTENNQNDPVNYFEVN